MMSISLLYIQMDLDFGLVTVMLLLKKPRRLSANVRKFLTRAVVLALFTVLTFIARFLYMKGSPTFSL